MTKCLKSFYKTWKYIHNSHTIMFCFLILYMSSRICSLKSTPNARFLRTFSLAILFTFRAFVRNLLKVNPLGLTSNKPLRYPLNYNNFLLPYTNFIIFEVLSVLSSKIKNLVLSLALYL